MINRTQKAIMSAIYKHAADKGGTCLLRPVELLSAIPYSVRFKREDLPAYLKSLQTDDYFELIETDKKGDMYYCFTLHQNGYAVIRQIKNERRQVIFKIVLTVCGALLSFAIGLILRSIFS